MIGRLWIALLATCSVLVSSAGAQQEPPIGRIAWASIDFPPFQIVDGPDQASGSFDGLRDLLIREMGDVEHDIVPMGFVDREEAFKAGSLLCSPGIFRTPTRERYLAFSKPTLIHLDNRLVFAAGNANRFPAGSPVNLETVFKDRWLVGGLIANRSFAPNIDALVRRYGGSPNVQMRSLQPAQVIDLLLKGKIDYTIMFSQEADFLERLAGQEGLLSNRKIAGTPPYILTHVACTRSEWGERVVARINRIVRAQRNRPEYRQLSERGYAKADKALIRSYYPQLIEADRDPPR